MPQRLFRLIARSRPSTPCVDECVARQFGADCGVGTRPDEARHAECLALLKQGGNVVYAHAILETFSTLTGGRLGVRADADLAAQLLNETILPRVRVIELNTLELLAGLQQAKRRGVRGGAIYDFIHLVAARKAGVEKLYTVNIRDFQRLSSEGDPEVRCP
jgi:predicted nucleic acid-binding protein